MIKKNLNCLVSTTNFHNLLVAPSTKSLMISKHKIGPSVESVLGTKSRDQSVAI